MNITMNTFCWYGIQSSASADFYTSVLGWTATPESEGMRVFSAPGGEVAHSQAPEGHPSWCSFLAVADLEASVATATEHGGMVLVPPMPISGGGSFSVVASPSGAVFGLYKPTETDVLPEPGPGVIHWVELHSTDLAADLTWLHKSFGLESKVQQMPSGPYTVLTLDGVSRGGAVAAAEGSPSNWLAWVQVDSIDRSVASVGASGGMILRPAAHVEGVGHLAVVADPGGAVFGLVQPAPAG